MANRTIYVSDEDQQLYQRAQDLNGGNLSQALVAALTRYLELEDGIREGYDEICLRVGRGVERRVRFAGVLLGEWGRSDTAVAEVVRVYRSRKGKFVVHRERSNDSRVRRTDSSESGWGWLDCLGLGERIWTSVRGETTLDIANSFEELRDLLPPEFHDKLAAIADERVVEDLDI
jgi:EXLDI family protein